MKRTWFVTAAVVAGVLVASVAQTGPIFLAGRLEGGAFIPDKGANAPCYTVLYSTIAVTIDGGAGRTSVRETISGPEKAVRTICLIPLPAGVDGRTAVVSMGPSGGETVAVKEAAYLSAAEAQKVYEAVARGTGSVELLALTGRPALLVREVSLKGSIDVTIDYGQAVRESQGVLSFECPMPATKWARGPVSRLSLKADVKNRKPLRAMFSPTHPTTIERAGLCEAVVRVKADHWADASDFRLCWVADEDDLGLRLLTYRAEGDDDGYFMLVGNPTGRAAGDHAIEKDVIFILDTSGSMRGEKIEQARAAVEYCLARLNPGDRFNIITFGTDVRGFRDGVTANTKTNVAAAQAFIEDIVASGRTNIGGALARALAGAAIDGRPRIAIFLTDGTPTAGELVPDKILEGVREANRSQTRIFVMGVGYDVNAHLLDKLAEMTDGSSEYVAPREEIDVKIAALYDRLSYPVLTNVAVAFGDLRTHSVYPQKLPALFKGGEIMVFGRYRDGGTHTATVSGTLDGKPVAYACRSEFPEKPAKGDSEFVAPLWASRKIGFLLQEIRLHGEHKELIEEVVALSKKFGIVTEYTEFIALARGDMSKEDAVREAGDRMRAANEHKAGAWAVRQAQNDRDLQLRTVAAPSAAYMDRAGNVVTVDRVRQVGSRVFYLRDGRWVDAEEAGARKTRNVKLFSDEYFRLLRENKDFVEAQSVGWNVEMNVGGERIVVEKDGKTKIDEPPDEKGDLPAPVPDRNR
jgi:Ca-activated chloride channel family protein